MAASLASAGGSTTVNIFTEENPQEPELVFGLSRLGYNVSACTITPVYAAGNFNGEFEVATVPEHVACTVRIFKGTTSSVDYMFFKEGAAPLLVESTKTLNEQSRNSSVFQRVVKFLVARHYYPDADMVMFYTAAPSFTSNTAAFGLRLFATLNVEVCCPSGTTAGVAFDSVEELIAAKNAVPEKAGNVSVRLSYDGSAVTIRGRLNKTAGRMDYDPNIGLFTGMMGAIHALSPATTFRIVDHGLDVAKIGMDNKFWYAVRGMDVTLDGFVAGESHLPEHYYKTVTGNEKTSTILFQHQSGLPALFHNHAGCQRSSVVAPDGKTHAVPKTITMPDIALFDAKAKTIYIVEGKDNSKVAAAQKQLDAIAPFEEFVLRHYPDFTCKRGLCVNMDTASKPALTYPVWFRLHADGSFVNTFNA
jgi:hypothetical protein